MSRIIDKIKIPLGEDWRGYVNKNVSCSSFDVQDNELFLPFIETFLYETSEYKDQGRLPYILNYYTDLNAVWFSVYAFLLGIEEIYLYDESHTKIYRCWDSKNAQVHKLYKDIFLPLLEKESDDYNKCILAYRFFISIYDYCGFKFVGKGNIKPPRTWKELFELGT